jgi:hypothetical protein
MKRIVTTLLLSLFLLTTLSAAPVDRETAQRAALQWMRQHAEASSELQAVDAMHVFEHRGQDAFYIVNMQPRGVVIVSADDLAVPVLMYSSDDRYDGTLPPALRGMLEAIAEDLAAAIAAGVEQPAQTAAMWEELLGGDGRRSAFYGGGMGVMAVSPLLSTTWNQTFPYNKDCPTTSTGGSGGHVYTGCVATAMAQVMKYWDFPATGVSSHSYTHSTYGTQSANFGNTTYNWSSMPNSVSASSSTAAKNAVGQLMYHCGVSVEMDYGPSGSASSIYYSRQVMPVFFRYKSSISYRSRGNYSASAWLSMITTELNAGRPLLYRGSKQNGTGGHAFIIDGFTGSDYFHMNFGWGGYLDGYFYLNAITPGSNTFNYNQAMVIGIEPDASPPPTLASPLNNSTNLCITPTLSWNSASGATSYRLQVATDQSFGSVVFDNASLTGTSTQVSGLSPASTYYWRMNATGSAGTSQWTSAWSFTTVNAVVTAGGPTSFCEGGSVSLSTGAVTGAGYMWTRNGVPVPGSSLPTLTATLDGQYRVQITVNGCMTASAPLQVTVTPLPVATIAPPQSTAICAGGSMLLMAQQSSGASYQWLKDGQNIPGATTPSYSANESGTYSVTVTTNGCSTTSDTLSLIVYPTDPASLVWTGAVDSDWMTTGNWDNPCAVPSSGDNVTIPSGCTPPAAIPPCTLQDLTIDNAAGTALGGNVMITGMLSLVDGTIALGNNDLTIGPSGEIIGGTVSSHIITDGMGQLRQQGIGSNGRYRQVLYPLANASGAFVPCRIINTATVNDFALRVRSDVLDGGLVGSPLTQGAVENSWILTGGSGSTDCSITLEWPASAEQSGFDRSQCFISSNESSQSWLAMQTPSPAQGSGPYTISVGGVQTLSAIGTPFAVGSGAVLYPVELTAFSAERIAGAVLLHWESAREVNSHGFEVQRRTASAGSWQAVCFVPSAPGAHDGATYRYRDDAAPSGDLHYRLRQVDLDGSSTYSPELLVQNTAASALSLSTVSPQPARRGETVRVEVRTGYEGHLRLVLYDMLGRPVRTLLDDVLQAGTARTLMLPTANLRAGSYFLQLQGGETSLLRRLTVLR